MIENNTSADAREKFSPILINLFQATFPFLYPLKTIRKWVKQNSPSLLVIYIFPDYNNTAKLIYLTRVYLLNRTLFKMDRFCENSKILSAVHYFCKKSPGQMFDWVLNTPLFYVFIVNDRDISDTMTSLWCLYFNFEIILSLNLNVTKSEGNC